MSYKINSNKKIDQNLVSLINILTEHKINYWICHGTLLGIIRDKKLIPWDHDIDIGVIENKKYRKILPIILKKEGFKEIKKTFLENDGMLKFVKNGGREVDINFYQIDKNKKTVFVKWYIPKNFLMKIIDALSFAKTYKGNSSKLINMFGFSENFFLYLKKILVSSGVFYSHAGYSHDKNYALKIKKYNFCGLKIFVPSDFNDYLRDLYGEKWKIPIKKYNWIKHSPSTILFQSK
tara:strand:- start:2712 stop:3416 length:705 start_codon:yes stop_codon:yes gene_type:complete